jgi:DNA polymerase I-like protein with 3'-5' exonuclease and polymerase domains
VDQTWKHLEELLELSPGYQGGFLVDAIWGRQAGEELATALFNNRVTTLTGRIRAGVDYGEGHNTPFQGLAADGAKVALWELMEAGYNTCGFIHDEVVVEVPLSKVNSAPVHIAQILKNSMASVMGPCDIPVEIEYSVGPTWGKK